MDQSGYILEAQGSGILINFQATIRGNLNLHIFEELTARNQNCNVRFLKWHCENVTKIFTPLAQTSFF